MMKTTKKGIVLVASAALLLALAACTIVAPVGAGKEALPMPRQEDPTASRTDGQTGVKDASGTADEKDPPIADSAARQSDGNAAEGGKPAGCLGARSG